MNDQRQKDLFEYSEKLKSFIKNIINNSPSLMTDMNFYENKINLLRKGENFMVNFYNIENKYRQMKQLTRLNEDHRDEWEEFS